MTSADVLDFPASEPDPRFQPLRAAAELAEDVALTVAEPFRIEAFRLVLADLLAHVDSTPPRQAPRGALDTSGEIAEFLAQLPIGSHPQRVCAIAYWHHARRKHGVATLELASAYVASRQKQPRNFPDVIAACVRKGWLMDGLRRDRMKTWVITATGQRAIEELR